MGARPDILCTAQSDPEPLLVQQQQVRFRVGRQIFLIPNNMERPE